MSVRSERFATGGTSRIAASHPSGCSGNASIKRVPAMPSTLMRAQLAGEHVDDTQAEAGLPQPQIEAARQALAVVLDAAGNGHPRSG